MMTRKLPNFSQVKALVIGDVMLDEYVHGRATRISPEAPVPVFNAVSTSYAAGGAANVALNLAALGCHVKLFGAVGRDAESKILVSKLNNAKISHKFNLATADRTTQKRRFVASDKHLLRMDLDSNVQWRDNSLGLFAKWLAHELKQTDVVILSDYNKGVLIKPVCQLIISLSRKAGVPTMVDPKGRDYSKYSGATLIKPNLKEFIEVSGQETTLRTSDWQSVIARRAARIGRQLHISAMLVTLGEKGMMHVPSRKGEKPLYLAAEAKEVFDVSGAGDTSMAVISAALALKVPVPEAVSLANMAAGIAVAKSGTSIVTASELNGSRYVKFGNKVVTSVECAHRTAEWRKQGKIIGFTNGCFDCCHLGHILSLQSAKAHCDILVVGVNSDTWISKHKGQGRPIQDVATRTGVLAALECVDLVVVFSTPTALPLVKQIRPQVIAKEGYSIENWPEGQYVQSIGGTAIELKRIDGYSTTALVKRIKGET